MPVRPGDRLGSYEILSPIGAGGMGEVYRATDTRLGREVAIKILPAEMAADRDRLARFHREARAVAALNHPGVVTLYSVEESQGVHFLSMELVDGEPLHKLIPADGFTAERVIELAGALAEAVAAAHDKGLVHRDLKPANIMITTSGRVKVLDFGLAKDLRGVGPADETVTSLGQTQIGTVMGTPPYMSPEQISGAAMDHRTDIFSLGIIFYEMLTGRRPFQGKTQMELVASILRDAPPMVTKTGVPVGLTRLIEQCLAKGAGNRIQTAHLLAEGLRAARLTSARSSISRPAGGDEGFWVAVLPFRAASGAVEIRALADGLNEEITTALSRFPYLRVIARGSANRYSSETPDIRTIGDQLGARYVMEGSLRQAGARLRVSVQMVDTSTGGQLWAETYERPFTGDAIFELQDDLVPRIVATVASVTGVLSRAISQAARSKPLDGLTPYESLMRCFGYWERQTPAEHASVRDELELAIDKHPNEATIHAALAMVYLDEYRMDYNVRPNSLERARKHAQISVDLAPSNYLAHYVLATVHFFQGDRIAFREESDASLRLNSLDQAITGFLAHLIFYSGDWDGGVALWKHCAEWTASPPPWLPFLPYLDAYRRQDYSTALTALRRANLQGSHRYHSFLAAVYGQLGDRERAAEAVAQLTRLAPGYNARAEHAKSMHGEFLEHFLEGLHKAGLDIDGLSKAGLDTGDGVSSTR